LNPAKADDRPMTRGGLGGIQDSSGGFNRKVQDKTYFSGLLRFGSFYCCKSENSIHYFKICSEPR
jgi:hypothetical protein